MITLGSETRGKAEMWWALVLSELLQFLINAQVKGMCLLAAS